MYTESTRPRDVSIFCCKTDMTLLRAPTIASQPPATACVDRVYNHSPKGDIVFCTNHRAATWGFAEAHPAKGDIVFWAVAVPQQHGRSQQRSSTPQQREPDIGV